jgi:acetyl esterase/lipase
MSLGKPPRASESIDMDREIKDTNLSLRARIAILLLRVMGVKNIALNAASLKHGEDAYWDAIRARQKRERRTVFPASLNPSVIDVDGYPITRIWRGDKKPDSACLFIHGGGFVEAPSVLHRLAARNLARLADTTVYFARYPLLPDAEISQILDHIKKAYLTATKDFGKPLTTVFGDSAGGGLTLYLASALDAADQPKRFLAVSACCDTARTNPAIRAYERDEIIVSIDLMRILSRRLLATAVNEEISPLYFSYENLRRSGARLDLFVGGREIMYPDNVLLHERLEREGVAHGWRVAPGMFHIYPLAPLIPECRRDFRRICEMCRG